jgi:proton-coupled amino acid transporter
MDRDRLSIDVSVRRKGSMNESTPTNETTNNNGNVPLLAADMGKHDSVDHSDTTHKTTAFQAYINMVRAGIGPGCMSLPFAFVNAGTVLGPGLLTILALLVWNNMKTLVEVRHLLQARHPGDVILTYGDVGLFAIGPAGKYVVEVMLVLMELGICTVYFEFFAQNVQSITADPWFHGMSPIVFKKLLALIIFPVYAGLSYIRHMRQLAPLSTIANFCMGIALSMVLGFAFSHISSDGIVPNLPAAKLGSLPLFFGTVIYSFEGCGAVLPVENSMRNPDECPKVLRWTFVTFYFFYMSVGLSCYLSYDKIDKGSITAVLEEYYTTGASHYIVITVNMLATLAVVFTYPIQFFAAAEVLENNLGIGRGAEGAEGATPKIEGADGEDGEDGERLSGWEDAKEPPIISLSALDLKRIGLRTLLVLSTGTVAVLIPHLGLVIALFGSINGAALALILPPILAIGSGHAKQHGTVVANWAFMIFGLVGSLAGTVDAAQKLINAKPGD